MCLQTVFVWKHKHRSRTTRSKPHRTGNQILRGRTNPHTTIHTHTQSLRVTASTVRQNHHRWRWSVSRCNSLPGLDVHSRWSTLDEAGSTVLLLIPSSFCAQSMRKNAYLVASVSPQLPATCPTKMLLLACTWERAFTEELQLAAFYGGSERRWRIMGSKIGWRRRRWEWAVWTSEGKKWLVLERTRKCLSPKLDRSSAVS